MKVAILTTSFPLFKGDLAGIFVYDQALSLLRQGISVQVVAPHHPGAKHQETMEGIPVCRFRYVLPEWLQTLCYGSGIPENLGKSRWAKVQLPMLTLSMIMQAIRYGRDCDVIHAHWPIAGLAGIIQRRISGRPVVMSLHHGSTRNLTGIERSVAEQVDYLICNSSFTLENVRKSLNPKACKVIPPGLDTDKFSPLSKETCRRDISGWIPSDRRLIFSLGRLIELKGHRYLIDALALLIAEGSLNPHLVIGGDGYLREELEAHARERGLSDRMTFLGSVPHDLTPVWYSAADVYVQPSIVDAGGNTEGLGMASLEALACATPCVGSCVGGIPDVIQDGINGFLVEPADSVDIARKLAGLLADENLRRDMGRRGREIVLEKFSWEAKTRELAEVYRNLQF